MRFNHIIIRTLQHLHWRPTGNWASILCINIAPAHFLTMNAQLLAFLFFFNTLSPILPALSLSLLPSLSLFLLPLSPPPPLSLLPSWPLPPPLSLPLYLSLSSHLSLFLFFSLSSLSLSLSTAPSQPQSKLVFISGSYGKDILPLGQNDPDLIGWISEDNFLI